jgi:putative transposase
MRRIVSWQQGKSLQRRTDIRILKEVETGTSVVEVCRKYEVAEQKVYRWRSRYGGLDTSELHR